MLPSADADATAELANPNNVVLKIARRKFGRAPVRAASIPSPAVSSARATANISSLARSAASATFRTSSWAPASVANRMPSSVRSALASCSAPSRSIRRAILEEAAGITRFKTKKRLAELRLEAARLNLSRVNDIFDEVTRQMTTLNARLRRLSVTAHFATNSARASVSFSPAACPSSTWSRRRPLRKLPHSLPDRCPGSNCRSDGH